MMKQRPTYDDYDFIRQLPDFIKYIRKFGSTQQAAELWQEFRAIAATGATREELRRYRSRVMAAKHEAEKIIA